MNQSEGQLYPAPPWRMAGELWMGLFRTQEPVSIPAGLNPLFSRHVLLVVLVRYLAGTLRYNELIIGPLARRGVRPGIHVQWIWVDSEESLWGGRCIWGLPKELARFEWDGSSVHISDGAGSIVRLLVEQHRPLLPLPLMMPGFGRLDGQWTYVPARGWWRPARARLQARDWSPRFGCSIAEMPALAVTGKPFSATFPSARLLGGER